MKRREKGLPQSTSSLARHGAGFLASGILALSVDALVLTALYRGLGINPFAARLVAIAMAMVAGWLAHRRWTFAVQRPPSLGEFASYATLAWSVAALNYAVYSAVLLLTVETDPLIALVVASLVAMGASYLGMRFGVFRRGRTR